MKQALSLFLALIPIFLLGQKPDTIPHWRFNFRNAFDPSIEGGVTFGAFKNGSPHLDEIYHQFSSLGISTPWSGQTQTNGYTIGLASRMGYIRYSSLFFDSYYGEFYYPYLKMRMANYSIGICPISLYKAVTEFENSHEIRPLIELSRESGGLTVVDSVHAELLTDYLNTFQQSIRELKINGIPHPVVKIGLRGALCFENIRMEFEVKYRLTQEGVTFSIPGLELKPPKWDFYFGLIIPLKILK